MYLQKQNPEREIETRSRPTGPTRARPAYLISLFYLEPKREKKREFSPSWPVDRHSTTATANCPTVKFYCYIIPRKTPPMSRLLYRSLGRAKSSGILQTCHFRLEFGDFLLQLDDFRRVIGLLFCPGKLQPELFQLLFDDFVAFFCFLVHQYICPSIFGARAHDSGFISAV